jgi:tetratricopeptide (TPR) repeat protein
MGDVISISVGAARRRLEGHDPIAAELAYGRALAGRPDLADAHNNLGRLLHDRGELAAAEGHYRLALSGGPPVALYWFNLGVVAEDRGRIAEAIAAYEEALQLEPGLADAHFNLARLLEGQAVRAEAGAQVRVMHEAVRHLARYRDLKGRVGRKAR